MHDALTEFWSIVREAEISAPSLEVLFLLVILSVCLLFKATRVGLLVAFLFVYRWGFLFFQENFTGDQYAFVYGYLVFGVLVVLLTIVSVYRQRVTSGD